LSDFRALRERSNVMVQASGLVSTAAFPILPMSARLFARRRHEPAGAGILAADIATLTPQEP
jgi:hypothetical protein